jgi:hypothetical protein
MHRTAYEVEGEAVVVFLRVEGDLGYRDGKSADDAHAYIVARQLVQIIRHSPAIQKVIETRMRLHNFFTSGPRVRCGDGPG